MGVSKADELILELHQFGSQPDEAAVKVSDLTGEFNVDTCDQLSAVLGRKWANEANWFMLSFPDREFPQLLLNVKGELACAHYLPANHAGFMSRGSSAPPIRGEDVSFPISTLGDQIEVMRVSIIPLPALFAAANEFFTSNGELPRCIEWDEL